MLWGCRRGTAHDHRYPLLPAHKPPGASAGGETQAPPGAWSRPFLWSTQSTQSARGRRDASTAGGRSPRYMARGSGRWLSASRARLSAPLLDRCSLARATTPHGPPPAFACEVRSPEPEGCAMDIHTRGHKLDHRRVVGFCGNSAVRCPALPPWFLAAPWGGCTPTKAHLEGPPTGGGGPQRLMKQQRHGALCVAPLHRSRATAEGPKGPPPGGAAGAYYTPVPYRCSQNGVTP